MAKPSIGDERYKLEHLSYQAWIDLAKSKGWPGGEDSFDTLREYCDPEDAALVLIFPTYAKALSKARELFKSKVNDSVFGADIISYQVLTEAHDDSGNLVRGCPPEWEDQKIWEVASDGSVMEVAV
jgi:hypothetical protein